MTPSADGAVLVAGSANLDFVVRAPHVPAPGETVLGRALSLHPGGKGANQAVACARAGGARTRMLVALGNDAFAGTLEGSLDSAGVELDIVRVADQATGTAFICVADDAENAITVAAGANEALRPEDLPDLGRVSHLLLQLETPIETVEAYAHAARAAGVTVVLNAAPARELPSSLLSSVDVLIVNEHELATLSGRRGRVAETLTRLDVPCVIVTLGARGCCARDRGRLVLQSAFRVDAVDTTGAGDTFCGALVASLCRRAALPTALRYASAAAALSSTRLGAQSSIPERREVEAFLTERFPAADEQAKLGQLAAYCGIE